LLQACQDTSFLASHPEDIAVCRINRALLESRFGIRFADQATAERFAFERTTTGEPAFGFHGIFNMIPASGTEEFWRLYSSLDDASTAFTDYRILMRQLGDGRHALRRRLRLTLQWLRNLLTR
jgi:hypothetical protein